MRAKIAAFPKASFTSRDSGRRAERSGIVPNILTIFLCMQA
jgi:hypothetical protein